MRPIGRLTHGRQQSILAALHHRPSLWSTRTSDGRSISSRGVPHRWIRGTDAHQVRKAPDEPPARDGVPSRAELTHDASQEDVDDGRSLHAIKRLSQYVNHQSALQKNAVRTDDPPGYTTIDAVDGAEPGEQLSEYDRAVMEQQARASSSFSSSRRSMTRTWNEAHAQQSEETATGMRIRKKRALALRAMSEQRLRKPRKDTPIAESLKSDEGVSSVVLEDAVYDSLAPKHTSTKGLPLLQPEIHSRAEVDQDEETLVVLHDTAEGVESSLSAEENTLGQTYEEGPLIYNLLPNSNQHSVDEEKRFPGRWGSEKRFPAFYGDHHDSESEVGGKSLLRGLRLTDSEAAKHENRPGHVPKTAVLIKGVSPNVKKGDFLRLAPTGLSGWAMQIKMSKFLPEIEQSSELDEGYSTNSR